MLIKGLALAASITVLAGCASGVMHKDMAASIPTMQKDQGRVYFMRTNSMLGAIMQPDITLNGQVVGQSKPGGFFYADVKPGKQEVNTTTETEKRLTFTLDSGETKYVKTSVGMGLMVGRVYPELISQAEAEKELSELSFTGVPPK